LSHFSLEGKKKERKGLDSRNSPSATMNLERLTPATGRRKKEDEERELLRNRSAILGDVKKQT